MSVSILTCMAAVGKDGILYVVKANDVGKTRPAYDARVDISGLA
jgi:hypothetical protein